MSDTQDVYKIEDGYLIGPSHLRIEAASLVEPERQSDPQEGKLIILDAIVEIVNIAYRQGRSSQLESYDERSLLLDTAASLDALSKLLGPIAGERPAAASKVILRLLQERL